MEGRKEVSIISHRPVSSRDSEQERLFFRWSVSTIFATGCSFSVNPLDILSGKKYGWTSCLFLVLNEK